MEANSIIAAGSAAPRSRRGRPLSRSDISPLASGTSLPENAWDANCAIWAEGGGWVFQARAMPSARMSISIRSMRERFRLKCSFPMRDRGVLPCLQSGICHN